MDGLFLIDKQEGYTSHDVVALIKKKFKLNKVGHTGTLDPFATGLLLILVGNATKLSQRMSGDNKSYEGTMIFGTQYDTYDITGQVMDTKSVFIDESILNQVMRSFVPSYMQVPPSFSAKKVDGVKAYEAARKGKALKLNAKEVFIHQFKNINFIDQELRFEVRVSSGTYIRSLAYDLGTKLSTYGALKSLRRTKIEEYSILNAKTIENVNEMDLIDHKVLFMDYPKVQLNDYLIKLVKNGVKLDNRQTSLTKAFVVVNDKGEYIAVYEPIPNSKEYRMFYLF